jgi:molybdenum cofactor cytidylyltransferase
MTVNIVLLAAGGSKRLGRPKQLLPFQGATLLSHAARQAVGSKAERVVVVLGPLKEQCVRELKNLNVTFAVNSDWPTGMSSSIRSGVLEATGDSEVQAVVIMACDQPYVTSAHLDNIINRFIEDKCWLVATTYNDTFGIPALFGRKYFDALCRTAGESGAKSILHEHLGSLVRVPLQDAQLDIDTEEDYLKLLQSEFDLQDRF